MEDLKALIKRLVQELFGHDVEPDLARTNEQFGDYATNVALQLAGSVQKSPRKIAEALAVRLKETATKAIAEVNVAGPGFINIRLSDAALAEAALASSSAQQFKGQEILTEFGDPNPLKAMHLGHLYTTIVGDTLSSLLESAGGSIRRLSYHGDVGMHVAKAIYAIGTQIDWDIARLKEFEQDSIRIDDTELNIKTVIGHLYAVGARAFEEDEAVAARIRDINAKIYRRDDEVINAMYEWGVQRSFAHFDLIFDELGVRYDRRYLESEAADAGLETVKQQVGKVFEESDGAIIYRGEKVGLHTRVFVNSEGLPTYEAKDLGLVKLKDRNYPGASASYIITANEQTEYFKVMLAALDEFDPDLANKTTHIAHGFLTLTTGKMSSRSGKVVAAQELLDATQAAAAKAYPDSAVQRDVYLAAVKYAFLKHRIGSDIVFDVDESVALEGNSGPYIQYAHARARSILSKAPAGHKELNQLESAERSLLRKIGEYSEVFDRAVTELMPHHVCTYLYELAQVFNRFYEQNRVIGHERENVRLQLVSLYAQTLGKGLKVLNIPAPEKM